VKIAAQTQLFQGPHPTLRVDAAQQKELASQIAATNRKIEALPMAQQEFVRLSLDVDVNTRLYTALLENEQQLEVVDAGTTGNVFVAEHAVAPEVANWPRIEVVLGSAALCGLLFAFVAVQIRATALGTIKDPLELDLLVDLPLLAVIPVSQTQDRIRRSFVSKRKHNPTCLLAHTHTGDRAVEALRSLRSAMQLSTDSAGKTVILFTGPTPNVGKTFISVNFAYLLAASGKRVVLIDADMRRSTVGRYIPLESKDGLAEVLSGRSTVDSVVRSQVQPNLDVIPAAGQRPKHPSELLESSKFADLIEFLRSKYDFVIIDSPPVLPVSDTLWMSRHADAVVVVSRAEITNPRHLIDAMSRLSNVNAKMAGQVFNGFEPRQSGYGYSYGYEYYAEERS
jgi:tyrosine-protein kinase Etk/Wzc